MAALKTVPLEILLLVLRKLDTIDVVRLGMTCKDLHELTQTHHVWLDQIQNHRRRTVALKLSIPSPTTLTTEALKRLAILQAKLRIRWNRSPDEENWEKLQFVACRSILLPGRLDLTFLPGGEFVVSIDEADSSVSLHRISFPGGLFSLVWLVDLSRGERDKGEVTWSRMLPAMAPHPVFSYSRANSVYLFGVAPGGRVNLETEFQIPSQSELHWVTGQGRIVAFVFQTGTESPVVTIIHLDHTEISLEIKLPPECEDSIEVQPTHDEWLQTASESWKVCLPAPDLVIVYGGDHLLAYCLPPFASLPRGKLRLDKGPIWRLASILEGNTRACQYKTSAEASHDPSLPQCRFNIHFLSQQSRHQPGDHFGKYTGLTTLNFDPPNLTSPSETPTHQRIVSQLPADGQMATGSLYPEIYHQRTQLHSDGLEVWITSLEDDSFTRANGEWEERGSLYMFVPNEELEPDLEWESVDLDEVSGRVFIWGPAYRWMSPSETRIFVGELVS